MIISDELFFGVGGTGIRRHRRCWSRNWRNTCRGSGVNGGPRARACAGQERWTPFVISGTWKCHRYLTIEAVDELYGPVDAPGDAGVLGEHGQRCNASGSLPWTGRLSALCGRLNTQEEQIWQDKYLPVTGEAGNAGRCGTAVWYPVCKSLQRTPFIAPQ